jgi:translation initiation factor 3 subunit C
MSRFFRSVGDSDSESSSSEEELMSSGDEEERPVAPPPPRPAGGMSRFLRTAGSESSSSESEDEDSDDASGDDEAVTKRKKSKYTFGTDDEASDDDVKRVVKSAKDKRFEEMEASTKVMENALKINDWVVISNGEYISFSYFWDSNNPSQSLTNYHVSYSDRPTPLNESLVYISEPWLASKPQ